MMVKYYSDKDLSLDINLNACISKIINFDEKNKYNINEILEYYNIIVLILEKKLTKKNWSKLEIQNYRDKCTFIKPHIIDKFLTFLDKDKALETYNSVEHIYKKDFFRIIEIYNLYNFIEDNNMKYIFKYANKRDWYYILENKDLVKYWIEFISLYLLKHKKFAELLLDWTFDNNIKVNIPIKITKEEKESSINKYLKSDNPDINYLYAILLCKDFSDFKITPKMKLIAKNKIDCFLKKQSSKNKPLYKIEYLVKFKDIKGELSYRNFSAEIRETYYNKKWILNNLDFPTLLNNFIWMFKFSDYQGRINLVNKENELSLIEKTLNLELKNMYNKGIAFDDKDIISILSLKAYYSLLLENNIILEDLLEWFFEVHIKQEFGIKNFSISMPSKKGTYREKCCYLSIEIEYILKVFKSYSNELYIDPTLIEFESLFNYNEIKSLNKKRNVYKKSTEIKKIMFFLFSEQSNLNIFTHSLKQEVENICDLIDLKKIKKSDIPKYAKQELNYLIDNDLFYLNNNFLEIKDKSKMLILKELYKNEVLNYYSVPKKQKKKIEEMVEKKLLYYDDSLLTKLEQDYLNFYLKDIYINSLGLRNKYVHGYRKEFDDNALLYENHYFMLLRIVVLIILKINDDLIIYDNRNK